MTAFQICLENGGQSIGVIVIALNFGQSTTFYCDKIALLMSKKLSPDACGISDPLLTNLVISVGIPRKGHSCDRVIEFLSV